MKKISFLKFCFTAILLAVFTVGLQAQSIWNADAAGGTVNWNTASNWIGGVPDATKTVTIYNCTTCPRINTVGNQSKFVQVYAGGKLTIANGGSLTIENPGGPGLKTHATSQVNVNQGGILTIQNFWGEGLAIGGMFQNGGTISINGGHTGIAVSAGASFTNNANGTTTVTGYSLNYAMTSSGTVLNNGIFTLDDANNDGINQPVGTITNGANGTLSITKTGVNGIFTKGTFNNKGILNIDNGLNGIYVIYGTFNNNASGKLTITGTTWLNEGIYVDPGTFKNSGELTIQNAGSKGIEISSGSTFNNFNKMTLNVPAWAGIFNVGGSNFTNKACAFIETNAAIVNYATFTNNGIIRETSGGVSMIGVNNGTVLNKNGGSFSSTGGNTVLTGDINAWTGCSSSDWNNPNNWTSGIVPTAVTPNSAIVQNVSQASGNAPVVSASSSAAMLTLDKNSNLTIASGGSLGVGTYEPLYFTFSINTGANLTIQGGGSLGATSTNLAGTIQNYGTLTIVAPFHGVGSFTMNGGTFFNNSGSQFIGQMGHMGAGAQVNLNGASNFTNNATITIPGFGNINLSQSKLTNSSTGSIVMPSGGQIKNLNASTVTNNGSIAIYRQSPEGIRCEGSTFTNTGGIGLSFTNILQYGGTFTNSGSISIGSPTGDGIANFGTFNSSGNLSVQQSGTFLGIRNQGTFSTGAGSLTVLDHVNYGVVNFSTFSNGGILNINTTNAGRGIENNQGNFVNQTTGQISIQNTVSESLVNGGNFTNNGQLTATGQGIATSVFFENTVFGNVTVHDVTGAGFHVFAGTCKNAGHISTENTSAEGLLNHGNLTNLPTGNILVKNAGIAGLANYATFTNQGNINAQDCPEGIRNREVFNSSGDVIIEGCYSAGVVNFKQMTNSGLLIVNVSPAHQTVNLGFINLDDQAAASFTNSGSVQIANIQKGMELEGGTSLTNSGSIEIFGDGQMSVGLQNSGIVNNTELFYICCASQQSILNAGGTLTNHACATLDVDQVLVNTAVFHNRGLLKTTANGINLNTGTFNNTGIIEDVFGSFNGVSFSNIAVRVRPISGQVGGFIQNALEIGLANSFLIGTTWYRDANLTNPGGTYNQGVNTFTPSVGAGTHTLYFTAKDLVNNCTKTVSVQVSIASAMKGIGKEAKPTITLYNYPNPFSEKTTLKLSLPFDSYGKLVVYDHFGRLVEEVYDGEILKDELYQFDLDASGWRITSYVATLILENGRTYPVRLVKADNQ